MALPGMTEQEVRELLMVAFEYSYLHEDWVEPLAACLEGVSAEQAAWRPGDDLMGIWDIVLHVAVWNENIIERIETGERVHPTEGAWPALPEEKNSKEWESAKQRLWNSIDAVKKLIETVPFEKVNASPYGFGDLVCRFNHMAYHAGQIEKIRECQVWM